MSSGMNLSNGKKSMATSTSRGGGWKSGDVVSDQFPVGLRVLVVDDDPICLLILEKMLRTCLYEVTKCNRAEHALSLLRENRNGFDIVISEVCMPDIDGFRLLECIRLEMNLPVIMMSTDDRTNVVMKGVTHGACDYLIKPVRIEALKNIWQHVVRKKKNDWRELEQSGSFEEGDRTSKPSDNADYSSSAKEGNWKSSEKSKDEDEEAFHKRLLQRPSYRNEKCSEAASSTDRAKVFDNAIGEGGFSTMAANSTSVESNARGEKTINVAGSSLKDATAESTGEERALSVLAGRPSKSRPSDGLAYSAVGDEAWNRMNENIDIECLLDEIVDVTVEACKTHRLPGAQIWSPCDKQSPKYGCRLSDENQNHCYHVWSRVLDNFLTDHRMYSFNQACSEHGPLIKREGVVGKAFATNQPWFSTDISSIPKTDYPLSEYARMFGMHSAVAVPLQIITQYNSTIYHVYEFFLPFNCANLEEQTKTVNALILTLEQGVKKIRKTSSLFHCIEFQLILRPVKGLEYCLAYNESSSFPEENLRGPPSDRRLLPEPSYQNNQWPDQTPSIKPAEVFDDAIGQGSSLSMAVNETSHGTGEKTINVPVISLKDATVKGPGGKSNKRDWAWEYCDPIEGNSNGMECSFCGLEIKGGGITRFKSHIYDVDPCKNVKKCKKVPPEDKVEIEKRMKGGYDKRK